MLALALSLQLAAASGNLAAAEAACFQLNYTACLDALQKAKAEPGNSRAALLRILELEGVTAAQLKQAARARDALRTLFLLEPEHKFASSYSPRVNTEILEARGWARATGPLKVGAAEPETKPGAVVALGLDVERNPNGLARTVRVHQRAPGAEASVSDLPVVVGHLSVPAQGAVVEWWAEVLGANDAVLVELGTERSPLTARAPEPPRPEPAPVAEAPVKPEPAARPLPAASLTETPPEPVGPRFRPAAWTALVLGVALAGAGGYFAYSSAAARNQLDHPMVGANGLVVGRTQAEAQALNATMQRDAWLANVMLAAGGVLAATGITLFIVGSSSGGSVGVQVATP